MPASATRPLDGADMFARLFDREIRKAGCSGFHSLLVLRLDQRPDVDALNAALAADTQLARGLRTPVRPRLPFLMPYFDPGRAAAPTQVRELAQEPEGCEPWTSLLNERLDAGRGRHIAITVFPVADGSWRLTLLFQHILTDAKGAERLLARLSEGAGEARWPQSGELLGDMGFGDVAKMARDHSEALEEAVEGGVYVAGAGGPRRGEFAGQSSILTPEETKAAVKVGRKAAGYGMEGLWYLACLLAAEREISGSEAQPGQRYAIPLPTSLDKKGADDRVFGNNLVFLLLTVGVEEVGDPRAVASGLKKAMMNHLRERSDRSSQAQMEFCKRMPAGFYSWLARKSMGGGFGSLFFTNPGPVDASLATFFGADVETLAHYPLTTPVPGLCGVTWTHRSRLGLAVTWLRGRFDDRHGHRLLSRWRERVLEAPE